MRAAGICVFATALLAAAPVPAQAPRFPASSVWHQDISQGTVHPQSEAMIGRLAALGGWGNSNRMQIDFGLHFRRMAEGEIAPELAVVEHLEFQDYYAPDCEPTGTLMPVPADAAVEAQDGLRCPNAEQDCHLLVQRGALLYEAFAADVIGEQINALCLAVWDLNRVYPGEGRGEHCTSADAAGFPIAALLPNPDDVAAAAQVSGDLGHAIRFILPNARMASDPSLGGVQGRLYVRPASHAGGPSGPVDTVPYGARLRLRGDFSFSGYNAAAQVILRTMQRYGMVLSDGGNIALTFSSDRHSTATWSGLGITPQIFWNGSSGNRTPLQVGDFAVIDTGPRIGETYECVRTPGAPGSAVFHDGFEGG
jgi:serine/threonine-protein kinase